MSAAATVARVETVLEGDRLIVDLGGVWRITDPLPGWVDVIGSRRPRAVQVRLAGLERWDSSLVRFVHEIERWCRTAGADCDVSALPATVRDLAAQLTHAQDTRVPFDHSHNLLAVVGVAATGLGGQVRD